MPFRIPDYHRLWSPFPEPSATALGPTSGSYYPNPNTKKSNCKSQNAELKTNLVINLFTSAFCILTFDFFVLGSVWASPRSLAATRGISFDFSSSGY